MENKNILIKKLSNLGALPLPSYATTQSAGLDLMAAIQDDTILKPLQRKSIPNGISIALPEGYEAQIRPRSGMAIKFGITTLNAPGTIDSDYRGEICTILINLSTEDFVITPGMRIAQMVIAQYTRIGWNIVPELPSSERDVGGFGSTGMGIYRKA